VVNKWDLFADQIEPVSAAQETRLARHRQREGGAAVPASLAGFGRWIQEKLFFLDYAPVIFTSATSGFHLERLLEAVRYVTTQLQQRVATALLNRALHDAIEHRQPVSSAGSRLKFYYATQVKSAPPTFLLFVNRKDLFSPAYEKYLANEMRRAFGYEGCPIVFAVRPRPRSEPGQRGGSRTAGPAQRVRTGFRVGWAAAAPRNGGQPLSDSVKGGVFRGRRWVVVRH
jgi:GTP-binding protein